jgi:hypothetical protein
VRIELVETYLHVPSDVFPDHEALLVRSLEWARGLANPPRPNLEGSLLVKLGAVRERAGDRAGAEKAYREAIAELAAPPNGPDTRPSPVISDQAFVRMTLAALFANTDRLREAQTMLEESIAELHTMIERRAGWPRWELIAMAQDQLAGVFDKLGDKPAAERARAAATDAWSRLPRPGGKGDGGFGGKKDALPPPRLKN